MTGSPDATTGLPAPAPGMAHGATPNGGEAGSRRIYVNRTSGVAHANLACRWLSSVPPDRLRVEDVIAWPPHRRLCPTCFPQG